MAINLLQIKLVTYQLTSDPDMLSPKKKKIQRVLYKKRNYFGVNNGQFSDLSSLIILGYGPTRNELNWCIIPFVVQYGLNFPNADSFHQ